MQALGHGIEEHAPATYWSGKMRSFKDLTVGRTMPPSALLGPKRPQAGGPEHFASLAKHVDGSVVLLRSNSFSIVP